MIFDLLTDYRAEDDQMFDLAMKVRTVHLVCALLDMRSGRKRVRAHIVSAV